MSYAVTQSCLPSADLDDDRTRAKHTAYLRDEDAGLYAERLQSIVNAFPAMHFNDSSLLTNCHISEWNTLDHWFPFLASAVSARLSQPRGAIC